MAFKSKADKMFDEKMKLAVNQRDWEWVEELFAQYGAYLSLIQPHDEVPPPALLIERPLRIAGKQLEFVGHNEPSQVEEMQYVLSGEHARFCVETLHADPVTLKKLDPAARDAMLRQTGSRLS